MSVLLQTIFNGKRVQTTGPHLLDDQTHNCLKAEFGQKRSLKNLLHSGHWLCPYD
ncbi:MAG: hypothetical protein H6R14_2828 [Proteobacteria bacterium]|nr:hypothetical protein [Pseudomonadota bacterium]